MGDSIDPLFLRESSEGHYLSRGIGLVTEEAAPDNILMTPKGYKMITRFAFKLALQKERGPPEDGKKE